MNYNSNSEFIALLKAVRVRSFDEFVKKILPTADILKRRIKVRVTKKLKIYTRILKIETEEHID